MNDFKMYLLYVKLSIKSQISYPLDFLVQIFIWFVYTLLPFLGLAILFTKVSKVGNWTFYHSAYLYGVIGLGYDFARMFARGFDNFHEVVYKGELDRFMIRPIGLVWQIMGNDFFLRRLSGILNYVVVLFFAIVHVNFHFSLLIVSVATFFLFLATFFLFFGLFVFYGITCFFSIKKNIFSDVIIGNTAQLGFYPLEYIAKAVRYMLFYVIPIGFVSYLPAKKILFGQNFLSLTFTISFSLFLSIFLLWISLKLFEKFTKFYVSPSN